MDDFWGQPEQHNPTYSQALRQFVRFKTDSQTITALRRLAADQGALERKWHASREVLRKNGASEAKLTDFDRRIHFQASKLAQNTTAKLEELGLPLFRKTANSPTLASDRAKFMAFLSDLVAYP